MASLASSKKRKRKEEHIKAGTIFYVKWNMEDGSKKYYKAFATGKNIDGEFEIKYVEGGSTEMRKISTIDDRSKTLISQEKYNNTKSGYPPKKPKIGEDHQVGQLPPVGSNNNFERAKSMTPLTTREIKIMSATPLTNREAAQDMHESGMSVEGWKGGKTRRRRKKKRRKSRKKRKTRRRKRRSKKAGTRKRRSPVPTDELERIADQILDEINNAYPNDERSRNIIKKNASIMIETPKTNRLSTLVDQKEELDSYTNKAIMKIMDTTGSTKQEAANIVTENKRKIGILLDKIYDIVQDISLTNGEKMWILHYIWNQNN